VNEKQDELTVLTASSYPDVVELFELARRQVLNVDAAIDDILGG
jgi:hypothetical protein